ncbi:hypothetical protein ALC53_08470 [Atta colombica]|uniref:Uncharacterized protein n=1 Tax=Atta colombica TaxID=520822 RepID=A0A195BA68_9HYME|nr:hypothetical protein ALC53_08470 [Atta colombica]
MDSVDRLLSSLPDGCFIGISASSKTIGSRRPVQTLRSEQTGGPISGMFAGGLAILLDTLFRSSDADTNAGGIYSACETADG